jgi:ATP-dependent protease ClpP protease subunit
MSIKTSREYFKVISEQNGDDATILLYGAIGMRSYYDENKDRDTTDIEFARTLNTLSKKAKRIHVRLNSPGGSTLHGWAIVAAIRACSAEVHTYVDGIAASMAADIFLAGHVRHMNPSSLLMIHDVRGVSWQYDYMNSTALRDEADNLDKMNEAAIAMTASCTGMSEDDVKKQWYDGKDHWLSAKDCAAVKIIAEIEDYKTESTAPKDAQKIGYPELVRSYLAQEGGTTSKSWLDRLTDRFRSFHAEQEPAELPETQLPPSQKLSDDMNLEDFQKSLTDGTLSPEAIQAALDAHKTAQTPPAPTAPAPEKAGSDEFFKVQLQTLTDKLAAQSAEIVALKAAPGAKPAIPQTPNDPADDPSLSPEAKELKALNAEMAGASKFAAFSDVNGF